MNMLFCSMLCSDPELDSHKFKDILDETIAAGELNATKAYQKWAKQVVETEPPTDPLKQRKKSNKESESKLLAVISQRRSQRKEQFVSMFSSLMAKYNGSESHPEPTEKEFEAARKKVESHRQSKKAENK
uniref:DNAJC9 HTH domain-containing protein n=1 Tax=Nelumbo nucifera TaxID=4432 RepID=A0A822ZB28_NELNU|nr:TPA_asm: hypothetical protein HUJ06_015153 [Nelumbo nucifera]